VKKCLHKTTPQKSIGGQASRVSRYRYRLPCCKHRKQQQQQQQAAACYPPRPQKEVKCLRQNNPSQRQRTSSIASTSSTTTRMLLTHTHVEAAATRRVESVDRVAIRRIATSITVRYHCIHPMLQRKNRRSINNLLTDGGMRCAMRPQQQQQQQQRWVHYSSLLSLSLSGGESTKNSFGIIVACPF
jgi:hypothetical protein